VDQVRQPKDVIIVSIHWGPNGATRSRKSNGGSPMS
jgi:hypothetical protein